MVGWPCAYAALIALLASLLSAPVHAQATFFQVPSGDVPKPRSVSAQTQALVSREASFAALFVVGLGYDLEIGATLYSPSLAIRDGHVRMSHNALDPDEPLTPSGLVSAQKRFELAEPLALSLGGQLGSNLAARQHMAWAARGYLLLLLHWGKRLRCSGGPYAATRALTGDPQPFGGFVGCDAEFGLFGFEIDWDPGRHVLGAVSLGPRLHLGKHVALSAGAQLPNAWSDASYAGIAQLELAYPQRQE